MQLDPNIDSVRALGQHVLYTAYEHNLTDETPADVDWSIDDLDIEHVACHDDDSIVEVEAATNVTVTRDSHLGYRTYTTTVIAVAHMNFSTDPLAGNGGLHVTKMCGTPDHR